MTRSLQQLEIAFSVRERMAVGYFFVPYTYKANFQVSEPLAHLRAGGVCTCR